MKTTSLRENPLPLTTMIPASKTVAFFKVTASLLEVVVVAVVEEVLIVEAVTTVVLDVDAAVMVSHASPMKRSHNQLDALLPEEHPLISPKAPMFVPE